jgi:hypothetical protein
MRMSAAVKQIVSTSVSPIVLSVFVYMFEIFIIENLKAMDQTIHQIYKYAYPLTPKFYI